jgi:hypothetical protein
VRHGTSCLGSESVREWHGAPLTVKTQTERLFLEEKTDSCWKSVVALSENLQLAHMLSRRHKNATKCCKKEEAWKNASDEKRL